MNERLFNYCLEHIHDKSCFDVLYNFYYRRIVIHINRIYKLGPMSEDVAQESFMALLRMKNYKYIKFYTSWMYKISENIALRKIEKENSEQKKWENELEKERTCYTEEENFEIFGDLQKGIERLDKDSQKIFYYHYVEFYTLKEIAVLLGISYDNVRQKHHRGLNSLRKNKEVSHNMLLSVFL